MEPTPTPPPSASPVQLQADSLIVSETALRRVAGLLENGKMIEAHACLVGIVFAAPKWHQGG